MDDTCHIEGGLHGEVISPTPSYFLIISHDAGLGLPEINAVFVECVAQFFSDVSQGLQRCIGPVAVSHHERLHVAEPPQTGFGTVIAKERLYLVTARSISHVCGKHAPVVRRFTDEYVCIDISSGQFGIKQPHHPCHLLFGGRSALLFGSGPVPVSVGFIEGADIVEMDAVMTFHSLHHVCHISCEIKVVFLLEVERPASSGICGESVLCESDGRRVEESEEMGHASFFGELEEPSLSLQFVPVIVTLVGHEALAAGPWRTDLAFFPLFGASCSHIEAPERKPNSLGLSAAVVFSTEEPVSHLLLHPLIPSSHMLHTPAVRSAEMFHGLQVVPCVYHKRQAFGLTCHGHHRPGQHKHSGR